MSSHVQCVQKCTHPRADTGISLFLRAAAYITTLLDGSIDVYFGKLGTKSRFFGKNKF